MAQLGHAKLETTQIYAAAVGERRRATVMAIEFAAPAKRTPTGAPRIAKGRARRSA